MATANLNKSEDFVTNTTAASNLDPTLGVAMGVTAIYRFMWTLRVGSGPI